MMAFKINYSVFNRDVFVDRVWADNEEDATHYFNMFFSDIGAVITSIEPSIVQCLLEQTSDN